MEQVCGDRSEADLCMLSWQHLAHVSLFSFDRVLFPMYEKKNKSGLFGHLLCFFFFYEKLCTVDDEFTWEAQKGR